MRYSSFYTNTCLQKIGKRNENGRQWSQVQKKRKWKQNDVTITGIENETKMQTMESWVWKENRKEAKQKRDKQAIKEGNETKKT